MTCIDEGFFLGRGICEPLDLLDLTVEIDMTFRIPRPMDPIYRGPPQRRVLITFIGAN